MSGTQKMDKFVLPSGEPVDLEAEMKAALERSMTESEQRMQAAAVAAPTPQPVPVPASEAETPLAPEVVEEPADALRTALAKKFVSLADDVTEAFAEFHIGGGDYVVELTAPQGQSTGGGKQALQHLRLRPRRPGYPVIVGGSVDGVNKTCELRDFDYVRVVHSLRFQDPLDLNTSEWEQFLRKAEVVLKAAEITTTRIPPPIDLLRQASAKRISRPMLAAFIIVTVLASFVVWRVLLVVLQQR
jgi:hypothetical protein